MQYGCFGYVMKHADYVNHKLSKYLCSNSAVVQSTAVLSLHVIWEYCYRNQSYWEQKTKKLDVPNQISFEEFEDRLSNGYYEKNGLKLCKTIQTFVNFLNEFPQHREEILKMFNYKLKDLVNPTLWTKKEI